MHTARVTRTGITRSLLLLVAVAACGSGTILGPDNQLQFTNATDSFQIQASNMVDITQTLSYDWVNTGTRADVNQSGVITSGTATLRISDADGTEVYSRSLTETGTFQTASGTSGTWSIEVVLSGASGALNFRVQKP